MSMADNQVHDGPTAEQYGEDLDNVTADLEAVEAAMLRLDEGTYGRCMSCGRDIPEAELTADPLATTCAAHAAPTG